MHRNCIWVMPDWRKTRSTQADPREKEISSPEAGNWRSFFSRLTRVAPQATPPPPQLPTATPPPSLPAREPPPLALDTGTWPPSPPRPHPHLHPILLTLSLVRVCVHRGGGGRVPDGIEGDGGSSLSIIVIGGGRVCGYIFPANRSFFLLFFLKVDLDLGNYERFLDIKLTRDNNITTGKIYQVIGQMSPNPCAIRNFCGVWSYQVKSLLLYFPIFFF
jgi:hypothetical protein